MKAYADPNHPGNGPEHHTGKECVEVGCHRPAGTAWSPHWCFECNVARIDRISKNLDAIFERSRAMVIQSFAEDLRCRARRQIELVGEKAEVSALIKGRWGTRKTRRLDGKGSPNGRIVSDTMARGYLYVFFPAREVLDWLDKEEKR